jgi:hypothetical protein
LVRLITARSSNLQQGNRFILRIDWACQWELALFFVSSGAAPVLLLQSRRAAM